MKKSNCCAAALVDETDVCSKCKEHCEVAIEVDDSLTTDDLLEKLPDHLCVVQNRFADADDRWRIYNLFHKESIEETGSPTAKEAIIKCLKKVVS